ncbi:MAG: membrane protein insertion efficiency factor YidD [Planctomycetes bacterium]|nr:membrane protein insertion efficiency factor YidD [Planctomycetota bacterium]
MSWLNRILILPIRAYQLFISPLLPHGCRYYPTCSEYFIQALRIHFLPRALFYGLSRILRCHPWGGSGFDPVPEAHHKK